MPTLLVQSCSKSKIEASDPVPAVDLYSGYFFKIIKKARRDGAFDSDIDVCILSAKYGLIDADREIEPYDRRMNAERARELADDVQKDFRERVCESDYDRVVVNAGKYYRRALDGIGDDVACEIDWISGDGIGTKGRLLKQFVRGDDLTLQGST